jgi:GNAT superfamily N-acetyltransferase
MPAPQPAKIHIRPATAADVPLILDFIRGIAEYEKLLHAVVADVPTLRRQLFPTAAEGGRPAAEVLIGHLNDEPQGFALFFQNFSTFVGRTGIYLEDLFVRPAARGVGLGAALFAAVASEANRRGCARMEWSVLDWNTPAIDFYKQRGAAAMDEWTVFRLTGDALNNAGR